MRYYISGNRKTKSKIQINKGKYTLKLIFKEQKNFFNFLYF